MIGKDLRLLRKHKGISQKNLASMLDVSTRTIVNWESDKCDPSLPQIIRLLAFFNIQFEELAHTKRKKEISIPLEGLPPEEERLVRSMAQSLLDYIARKKSKSESQSLYKR